MSNKVYEIVTNKIIEQLEKGTVPWHKTWISKDGAKGDDYNMISKKPYRGINRILLSMSRLNNDLTSNQWLTFKQANEKGGSVKAGEKATMVVFWKPLTFKKDDSGNEIEERTIPILRYYNVFNVEQTTLEPDVSQKEETKIINKIEECENILSGFKDSPVIDYGYNQAFYSPLSDKVSLPDADAFDSEECYYTTLFHELVHSTGHKTRLSRAGITSTTFFGDHEYSREELIAEMGAAFLCSNTGIENKTIDNSAAYIKGWLKKLRDDKRVVILAASAAQKASDYILSK